VTLSGAAPAKLPSAAGDPARNVTRLPEDWIALARAWAGPSCRALIVSGSHACGDAVWTTALGRPLSLSDLDLYAVVPDRAAQRAACRRAAADRPGLAARLEALGLAGSLEVAFLTPEDLGTLPARPGSLELKRHGRVVEGDPAWLARVPGWTARDVSAEEALLLLENRALELLDAAPGLARTETLARLASRHAVLKAALDLAGIACLAEGEYPDGAAARVAFARARAPRLDPEPPWEAALAWRAGCVAPLEAAEGGHEWRATVEAWVALWRERVAALPGATAAVGGGARRDDYAAARFAARRARLRRRARQALFFNARSGAGPGLLERVWFWTRGTPQHRLGASAAVMLVHAVASRAAATSETPAPAEPGSERGRGPAGGWRDTMAWLGVVRHPGEPDSVARELVRSWDRWVLDGQRTAEAP
jgi:hypothetical protein